MINSGDKVKGKLSARFFNRGEEVFDWYDRTKARGEGDSPQPTPVNNVTALIRNNTSIDLRRGEVVEFDGSLLTQPDPRVLSFSGVTPDLTHIGWGITLQQIPAGSMNDVLCLGVCIAHVQFSDESHEYAERVDGQRVLNSAGHGPVKILHKGIANPSSEGEYECIVQIMDGQGGDPIVRFELAETLPFGGAAEAHKLAWNEATSRWEIDDEAEHIVVTDWWKLDDVTGEADGMWNGIAGYRGLAVPRNETIEGLPSYDIIWMERIASIISFIAQEKMGATTGFAVEALVYTYDHQGRNPGSTVTVHDPLNQWPDLPNGASGVAYYDHSHSEYRILTGKRLCRYAYANLNVDLCGESASTYSITDFVPVAIGDYQIAPNPEPTVARNPFKLAGVTGDLVGLIRRDDSHNGGVWDIIAMPPKTTQMLVDVRWTGTEIQKKYRTVYVQWCDGTTPDWVTVVEAKECTEEDF